MNGRGLIDGIFNHYKLIMAITWIAIFVCAVICIIATIIANDSPKDTLVILNVAPVRAEIKLDGQVVASGSHSVTPGEHTIELSAEGFESKISTISAMKDKTLYYSAYLTNKNNGLDYYKRSSEDISVMRIIAKTDNSAKEIVDLYDRWYSIVNVLPLSTTYNIDEQTENVSITYSSSSSNNGGINLYISGNVIDEARAKIKASELLSDNGFNVNDYEVIYAW